MTEVVKTYYLTNNTNNVEGTIEIEIDNDGYVGTGIINSQIFVTKLDGIKKISITTPIIQNPNYNLIANEVLRDLNNRIKEFNLPEIDPLFIQEKPDLKPFKITGVVVDSQSKESISGVNVKGNNYQTTTNPRGVFTLEGEYEDGQIFSLTLSLPNYTTKVSQESFNGDKTIKTYQIPFLLDPIKTGLDKENLSVKKLSETQKKKITDKLDKDFISIFSKKILNQIREILLPVILRLIADLGVAGLEQLIKKVLESDNPQQLAKEFAQKQVPSCPADVNGLNELIQKKNQLVKQLNNIYKGINSIQKSLNIPTKFIEIITPIIPVTETSLIVAGSIPGIPIPPAPFDTAFKVLDKLRDLITSLGAKLGSGSLQLSILLDELNKTLALLALLDNLIQKCTNELGGTPEEQEAVSQELLDSTQNQSNQLSPVVTNVNGFEMSVITVDGDTDQDLKRRRAVARNKSGIIMLQGEPSYSSNDQILIDELVFYIQQNDLKAD